MFPRTEPKQSPGALSVWAQDPTEPQNSGKIQTGLRPVGRQKLHLFGHFLLFLRAGFLIPPRSRLRSRLRLQINMKKKWCVRTVLTVRNNAKKRAQKWGGSGALLASPAGLWTPGSVSGRQRSRGGYITSAPGGGSPNQKGGEGGP